MYDFDYAYSCLASYGTLNLTATSPPQSFDEPITLGQVRAQLHLPSASPSDSAEDDLLGMYMMAARVEAELAQGRDLVVKQYDLSRDWWRPVIELRPHLISVDLVQYKNSAGDVTALVQNTDYVADPAKRIGIVLPAPGKCWPAFNPWPSSAVLIRFQAGLTAASSFWTQAGAVVKVGMLYLIGLWYEQRLPFEMGSSKSDQYTLNCLSFGGLMKP